MLYHPRKNEKGNEVIIRKPHTVTPLDAWHDPSSTAIVTPDALMPGELNGIAFKSWTNVPVRTEDWAEVAGQALVSEPAFKPTLGMNRASGVVVIEPDGRVWLVAPTNGYGGYLQTFPKGKVDEELSLQANAIKEAYEETGLQVAIDAHLVDVPRSTSYTRYYLGHRVGGNPASVGWESQAVLLVTMEELPKYLTNSFDKPVIESLVQRIKKKSVENTI